MSDIDFTGGITSIPPGSSNMSTALAAADDQLKDPAAIVAGITAQWPHAMHLLS